jgi:hypothetical protein
MKLYNVKVNRLSNGYEVVDSELFVLGSSIIYGNTTATHILEALTRNGFFMDYIPPGSKGGDLIIDTEFTSYDRNYKLYMKPLISDIISIDRNNKINGLI